MHPARIKLPASPRLGTRAEFRVHEPPSAPRSEARDFSERVGLALTALVAWMSTHSHFLVSLCVHAAICGILGALILNHEVARPSMGIEAFLGEEDGLPVDFGNVGDHPALKLDEPQPRDRLPMIGGLEDLHVSAIGSGLMRAGPGSADDGDENPGGQDIEINIGFFGTAAEGRTFVFIVDASGSMTENNRWGRAITELSKSIGKLKPHQQFYVYFFSDADKTMRLFDPRPPNGLVDATPGNKTRAQRWIRGKNIRPGGLTNPEIAVEEALGMKPDVIFLMTDGEFDDPDVLIARIERLNAGRTCIHTIALQNEGGAETLDTIAKQNRGTYRFVK
jgi:hypothetical protein